MRDMSKYAFKCEVEPRFLPAQSMPHEGVFAFSYTVTVTNTG